MRGESSQHQCKSFSSAATEGCVKKARPQPRPRTPQPLRPPPASRPLHRAPLAPLLKPGFFFKDRGPTHSRVGDPAGTPPPRGGVPAGLIPPGFQKQPLSILPRCQFLCGCLSVVHMVYQTRRPPPPSSLYTAQWAAWRPPPSSVAFGGFKIFRFQPRFIPIPLIIRTEFQRLSVLADVSSLKVGHHPPSPGGCQSDTFPLPLCFQHCLKINHHIC